MESSWSYGLEGGFWVSDNGLEFPVETLKRTTNPQTETNLIIPFCEGEFMMWNSLVSSASVDRDDDYDGVIKMLSSESSLPSKRARTTNHEEMKRRQCSPTYTQDISVMNFSSQVPVCQVHGCKRDLRNCKHYHRKHKVCPEHSMAAQVVVNGAEQRFCQQCSRFHIMAEFDDKKRSCRKRLTQHNERRRKPLNQIHWGPAARLLDMASQRLPMPFHFPAEFSHTYFCHDIYGKNSNCQIESTVKQSNAGRKQASMETLSSAGQKSRRAFSLLSAEPSSGNLPITSNSLTLHGCNNGGFHNGADQPEGNYQESGPVLDLQQLSALLHRVQQQQQQELASF